MLPMLAAAVPALAEGFGKALGGGTPENSSATGGRGPTLGNYAKGGGSNGVDTMQILMIGGFALFGIVLLKKVR